MKKRILIADPSGDTTFSLGLLFERHGCEVRLCSTGSGAMLEAAGFLPHLVVLELTFDFGPTGLEVAAHLRSAPEHSDIAIAAVTKWSRDSDISMAWASGFDHYFVKPCDPMQLVELALAADPRSRQPGSWPVGWPREAHGATAPAPAQDRRR